MIVLWKGCLSFNGIEGCRTTEPQHLSLQVHSSVHLSACVPWKVWSITPVSFFCLSQVLYTVHTIRNRLGLLNTTRIQNERFWFVNMCTMQMQVSASPHCHKIQMYLQLILTVFKEHSSLKINDSQHKLKNVVYKVMNQCSLEFLLRHLHSVAACKGYHFKRWRITTIDPLYNACPMLLFLKFWFILYLPQGQVTKLTNGSFALYDIITLSICLFKNIFI